MNKSFFILLFLNLAINSFAQLSADQQVQVDSIKQVISTAQHDTTIVNGWIAWNNIIYASNPELDYQLNQKIDSLCNLNLEKSSSNNSKNQFYKYKAKALKNIGTYYYFKENYTKTLNFWQQSLAAFKITQNNKEIANSLSNIGVVYADQGNDGKAIVAYTKSLKIREQIGDKIGIAKSLNNIGNIYSSQGAYDKALNYFFKSLEIKKEIGEQADIANSLNNIGLFYARKGNNIEAENYYIQCLNIKKEINDQKGVATSLTNIGIVNQKQGNYDQALNYFTESLEIDKSINNKMGLANTLCWIATNYHDKGDDKKALKYGSESIAFAQETGTLPEIKTAAFSLWVINKSLGNYKESLKMYELFIVTRDSIKSVSNQKELIRQEYKHTYEKQADSIAIEQLKKDELALAEEKRKEDVAMKEHEKKNLIIGVGAGGLALVLFFAFFVINRLRVTRKQKDIIEIQKVAVEQQKSVVEQAHEQLEEKNTEIMDSIVYAKRIQSAILPPSKLVKEYLQESFILYKPKDVVAGDFYWMEHSENKVLFAAADCTGHGVPGAMVSVICNNGLNRSVREYGLTDPGQILDKTREVVIQEFEKSEEEVKDGMDIALCSLEGTTLKYAGANNPLWIIRSGEILETKADKQPIGKYIAPKPFTTHIIELEKGDVVYIFSDGYVDQFGGEKGKKYKPANLRKLLLSIQDKSMEQQKVILDEAFETWRGNLEQIDDVCVIGVRI